MDEDNKKSDKESEESEAEDGIDEDTVSGVSISHFKMMFRKINC